MVLALGQDVDLSLLDRVPGLEIEDGVVKVDAGMMTGHPASSPAATWCPASARSRSASATASWRRATSTRGCAASSGCTRESHELASFDKLNTWYYSDASKSKQPVLDTIRRQSTFDEVVGSFDETTALFEARRCLSCGNCFECDNCYGVCPDNAVIKLGPGLRYAFNYDYCKGCGLCVSECPCGAIRMVPEEI